MDYKVGDKIKIINAGGLYLDKHLKGKVVEVTTHEDLVCWGYNKYVESGEKKSPVASFHGLIKGNVDKFGDVVNPNVVIVELQGENRVYKDSATEYWGIWKEGCGSGKTDAAHHELVSRVEEEAVKVPGYPSNEYTTSPIEQFSVLIFAHKIIQNGPATIVFYKDSDGKERKSVAKCHPGDVYDKRAGVEIASLKAVRREADRFLKKIEKGLKVKE